jgi:hypothetical protein
MKRSIPSAGPAAPRSVPKSGAVSRVGPSGAAPAPRIKNTREYGKSEEAPPQLSPNPFGSAGGSRLGGI